MCNQGPASQSLASAVFHVLTITLLAMTFTSVALTCYCVAGVLRSLFDVLYDEDIISEDAFHQWETSNDPKEARGKGVALASVSQFFTWLHEAEEEEQ